MDVGGVFLQDREEQVAGRIQEFHFRHAKFRILWQMPGKQLVMNLESRGEYTICT